MSEGPATPQEQYPPIIVHVSVTLPQAPQEYAPPSVQTMSGAEMRSADDCWCRCGASSGAGVGDGVHYQF
jgi:hypothetical protein